MIKTQKANKGIVVFSSIRKQNPTLLFKFAQHSARARNTKHIFLLLHSPPQKSKCLYSNSPPPRSDLRRRYRAPGITRSQPLLSQRESQAQEPALTPRH